MKKTAFRIIAVLILATGIYSCTESSDSTGTVSDNLHLAFKTPDWERNIDCTLLDLTPMVINDSTFGVGAMSASTRESFFFTYPRYSSKIVSPKYLRKYKIVAGDDNNAPFQFSQILPLNANSLDDDSKKLISFEGFSASEYNQVIEVKYLSSETNYDVFRVKCKYEMKMYLPLTPDVIKPVSGTFTLKIRALKN